MLRNLIFLMWVLSLPVMGQAEIKPEGLPEPIVLPAEPNPHWVWVSDIVFHHMADGKAYLGQALHGSSSFRGCTTCGSFDPIRIVAGRHGSWRNVRLRPEIRHCGPKI